MIYDSDLNLEAGTILLVKEDRKSLMDNAVKDASGGNFAHVAISYGDGNIYEMLVGKGITDEHATKYLNKRYTVLIAEPLFLDSDGKKSIIKYLHELYARKIKYDYRGIIGQLFKVPDLINNKERMYCSELVADVYLKICDYRFSGLIPEQCAPKDIGFDVIARQHLWMNRYIYPSCPSALSG